MPRKIRYFILFIFCSALLSGCNNVVDLTEEQTKLVAEYAADVLLKYDAGYVDRFKEGEKKIEESADTEEITTTEMMDPQKESVSEQAAEESGEDNSGEVKPSVGAEEDIAKIAGISGVTITYKDYLVASQYPETGEEDEPVSIEASSGHQLLIIRFNVANVTKDEVTVSLIDKEIDYSIICNGDKTAKPMLTILLNDLGTIETTVSPDKEQEAVLVFQIAENIKNNLDSMQLKVTYNNTENVIDILK